MTINPQSLISGPYSAPICRVGDSLECEVRGRDVIVGGITDAPIQWPRARKTGKASLIVCGDLGRAVKAESEIAIAYHWGVSVTTVWGWRKALGVGRVTQGTARLYEDYKPLKLTDEVSAKGRESARSQETLRRMSETKRGRPAHPNTASALRSAAKQKKTKEHRQKIGDANRGKPRPESRTWTPAMESILGTACDRDIARKIGKTLAAVRSRRQSLRVTAYQGDRQ